MSAIDQIGIYLRCIPYLDYFWSIQKLNDPFLFLPEKRSNPDVIKVRSTRFKTIAGTN